jgi:hypothetical protein
MDVDAGSAEKAKVGAQNEKTVERRGHHDRDGHLWKIL